MSDRASTALAMSAVFLALGIADLAVGQPFRPDIGLQAAEPSLRNQAVEPGYLGLIADAPADGAAGVRVREVIPSGPAAAAGFQEDDLIRSANGVRVDSLADLARALEPLPPGEQVAFGVMRQGRQQRIDVTLGRRPPPDQRRFENFGPVPEPLPERQPPALPPAIDRGAMLGVRTQAVTPEARHRLRLPSSQGALVIARTVGSPAEAAGIPLDSVIVAVDGHPIDTPEALADLIRRLEPGTEISVSYYHDDALHTAQVKLARREASTAQRPPLPEPPVAAAPPPSGESRPASIDELLRRIEQLERRISQLEQALLPH
jgi:serine protease Do